MDMRLLVVALAASAFAAVEADLVPPRVRINLDLPARDRWTALATKYNTTLHTAMALLVRQEPAMALLFAAADAAFKNASKSAPFLPAEHLEEMQGISRVTGFPIGTLVTLNAMYDFSASGDLNARMCTSIVAQGPGGAAPVHGRNLDYPFRKAMEYLTMTADYQRGSETVYSAVIYLGTVNFNTVVVPGAWSLSHDERDQGFVGDNWVDMFLRRRVATFSRIRLLAESAATYDAALEALRAEKLDAPSYFIVAGSKAGEGAIVTRGREPKEVEPKNEIYPLDSGAGRWFVVETNYDHWAAPGKADNRRAPAERALAALGSAAVTPASLLGVLSDTACNASAGERSVLNSETVYTAVMSPADGNVTTVLRTDTLPDRCPASATEAVGGMSGRADGFTPWSAVH